MKPITSGPRLLFSTIALLAAAGHASQTNEKAVDAAVEAEERAKAMSKFSLMRGVWIGEASGSNADGSRFTVTQTERSGPMLGGDLIVVEGRGYAPDGTTKFNAFGIISYDVKQKKYEFRSYTQGKAATFTISPTGDGFVWEIPAGPGVIRFTARIKDGKWHEVGERVFPGSPPARFFEMNLKKVGETNWPAENPVSPKAR